MLTFAGAAISALVAVSSADTIELEVSWSCGGAAAYVNNHIVDIGAPDGHGSARVDISSLLKSGENRLEVHPVYQRHRCLNQAGGEIFVNGVSVANSDGYYFSRVWIAHVNRSQQ